MFRELKDFTLLPYASCGMKKRIEKFGRGMNLSRRRGGNDILAVEKKIKNFTGAA